MLEIFATLILLFMFELLCSMNVYQFYCPKHSIHWIFSIIVECLFGDTSHLNFIYFECFWDLCRSWLDLSSFLLLQLKIDDSDDSIMLFSNGSDNDWNVNMSWIPLAIGINDCQRKQNQFLMEYIKRDEFEVMVHYSSP